MFTIVIYLVILLAIGIAFNKESTRNRRIQFVLCFFLLFLFYGFRGLPVLNDTAHYYQDFYERLQDSSFFKEPLFYYDFLDRFEFGYIVMLRFISRYVWSDPYSIILLSSLWTTIAVLWFVGKFTNRIALVIFILWLGMSEYYNVIRQTLSVIIFFVAYFQLEKRNYIRFVFLAALAFAFHRAGIVLFILPVITRLKFSKQNVSIFLIITVIVSYSVYPLVELLQFYETDYLDPSKERETLPYASIINVTLESMLLIATFVLQKKYSLPKLTDTFMWMVVISFAIGIIALPLGILGRYGRYFQFFPYLYFIIIYGYTQHYKTNFLSKAHQIHKRVGNRILYLLLALLFFKIVLQLELKNEWNHMIPYSFYDFSATTHEMDFGY